MSDIDRLVSDYRTAILEWDAVRGTPKKANRLFDRINTVLHQLRDSEEGRAGIAGLMGDDEEAVRATAATDALHWAPEEAERTLEAIEEADGAYGFDAKWTLKEWRAGNLKPN